MQTIPEHFKPEFAPIADSKAIVQAGQARFTVLTPRLIRLEYSPQAAFEDRASQVVWYRRQPVPDFKVTREGSWLTIDTEALHLRYDIERDRFDAQGLTITIKANGTEWRCGDDAPTNLKGTARTLDGVNGAMPLEDGLLSRSGWTVIDDRPSLVFKDDGWLEPCLATPDTQDLYFFGYGSDYAACLDDYYAITGPVPLLPRWALGNWWSRYHEYHQDELIALMEEFKGRQVPLSVCIVDMDWHLTETDTTNEDWPGHVWNDGWTGYTWNPALFPDPARFTTAIHDLGLRTALNLHPHAGVHPHESQYERVAQRMGIDPASKEPVSFDLADPRFANAYFEELHHPHEEIGIDFWWMDWQQGKQTSLPGLDPLWWLNHLHFHDLGRDGHRRPFVFSRWGGLGNHRYPIGFSGDTFVSWESLAFQPYFTASAANVGYGWWSHDIGGHYGGIEEPELYARWVQFGVFSPIFRLHATKTPFGERRPWGFGDVRVFEASRYAMQLRHRLIPYLYSMSWRYTTTNQALIRPMYQDYPSAEEAYHCPQQYTFGSELIAAPFTSKIDPHTDHSRIGVWLPEGDWYGFFDGAHYESGWHAIYGRLEDTPVFARAGAIVPLGPEVGWGGVDNPETLDVMVFAGASNRLELFEDDGHSTAFQDGAACITRFEQSWQPQELTFTIAPGEGDTSSIPQSRTWRVHVRGVQAGAQVTVHSDGQPASADGIYDSHTETLTIILSDIPVTTAVSIVLTHNQNLLARRDRRKETCLRLIKHMVAEVEIRRALWERIDEIITDTRTLLEYAYYLKPSHLQAFIEVIDRVGFDVIRDTDVPVRVILWNPQQKPGMVYHYTQTLLQFWVGRERYAYDSGTVPPFKVIMPNTEDRGYQPAQWQIKADYFGVTQAQVEA